MKFTDIFIRRPVLAVSISLLIIILGLQAISKLAVREYPKMTTTVITVTTAYPGADANLIQAFLNYQVVLKIQRFLHQPVVRGLCILVSVLTSLMQAK